MAAGRSFGRGTAANKPPTGDHYGQLWWFDEYDADLGQPLRKYQKDRYAPGTYSRDYQNGIVIVNPGKGTATVSLEGPMRDATTHQDAKVFVVPSQDARILVRQARRNQTLKPTTTGRGKTVRALCTR